MDPLHPYLTAVRAFASRERLFRRVSRVLVGVSGGPDSLAAMLLLHRLGPDFGFDVVACHFDHHLREGSADEQRRVRAICEALGLSCITGEGDVAAMASERRLGVEEAARRMRYQFLAFAAGKERADVVATGHTRDDQAETVLHHILRGSGVRGIRGMVPRSPLPGAEAQVLVRPLLCLGRVDTVAICSHAGIEPILDPSNADIGFTRNRIRHELLPTLERLNPSAKDALVRLAHSARETFAGIERAALATQPESRSDIGAVFALAKLVDLPTEALAMVIERESAGAQLGYEANYTRLTNLRQVLARGSGSVAFGPALVEVSAGQARIGPPLAPGALIEPVVLSVPGTTRVGDLRIEVTTEPRDGWTPIAEPASVLRARSAQPGDRVRRPDRRVRLGRVLADARVPAWERAGLVVVVDGEDVVAISGSGRPLLPPPGDASLWIRAVPIPRG